MFLINPDMDPTPKRNLVNGRQIMIDSDGSHPEENLGWEIKREDKKVTRPWAKRVDLDLWPLTYLNNNNNISHHSIWPVSFAAGKKAMQKYKIKILFFWSPWPM